jgi:hypothetical protein
MQYDDNVRDLFLDTDGPEPDWVQPWEPPYAAPELDRLTHLVLVDGRLVDMWSQPVTGTRWQLHADRIDRRARQLEYAASPPLPPPPPPYELMLDWLDGLVGGRRALDATDDEPLRAAGVRLGDLDPALEATDRLLAGAAERLFDAEVGTAFRTALSLLCEADREFVGVREPSRLAAGICWAVGRANDLVGSGKQATTAAVKRELGVSAAPATCGTPIRRALRGLAPEPTRRPAGQPDYLPLGHAALLTSRTRRTICRLRDRAVAIRESVEADEKSKARILPSEVES